MEPRGTILLVCVGDMPRMLLANYLEGLGYEVHSAGDPVEALGILTRAEIELAISLQVSPGEPFLFRTLEDGGINIPVLSLEPHDAGELPQRPGAAATLAWPAPRPEVAATVERLLSRVRAARYATAVHQRRAATDGGPATVPVREQDVERIGRYRVEELIGRGSMGEVFRCRDEIMGRLVAVKTMSYEIGSGVEKSFADRFMVEAGSLARLVHPGIVATHDFGIDQRRKKMFLVMEYVDGPTLLHEMKKGQMAIEIALRIGWDHDALPLRSDLAAFNEGGRCEPCSTSTEAELVAGMFESRARELRLLEQVSSVEGFVALVEDAFISETRGILDRARAISENTECAGIESPRPTSKGSG